MLRRKIRFFFLTCIIFCGYALALTGCGNDSIVGKWEAGAISEGDSTDLAENTFVEIESDGTFYLSSVETGIFMGGTWEELETNKAGTIYSLVFQNGWTASIGQPANPNPVEGTNEKIKFLLNAEGMTFMFKA